METCKQNNENCNSESHCWGYEWRVSEIFKNL